MPGEVARKLAAIAQNKSLAPAKREEAASHAALYFMVDGQHKEAAGAFLTERNLVRLQNPNHAGLAKSYGEIHVPLANFMAEKGPDITRALHEIGTSIDKRLTPPQRRWLKAFVSKAGRSALAARKTHENFREPPTEIEEMIAEEWEPAFEKREFSQDQQAALDFAMHVTGVHDLNLLHALALKKLIKLPE